MRLRRYSQQSIGMPRRHLSGRSGNHAPVDTERRPREWPGTDWSRVDVLVVVVTFRGGPSLARCLTSLSRQRPQDGATAVRVHVLVVDNGDVPATRSVLDAAGVDVVVPGRNLGFAGGANVGLRPAVRAWAAGLWRDGLVVLVNDDAVADEAFVAQMWSAHRRAPARVAAFTGLLLHADAPGLVNSTGTVVTSRGSGRDRDQGRPVDGVADVTDVFGFCGGAAALRPAALAAVGVFEDEWFLYYEDVDLSWRMRAHGYEVRHVRSARVLHEVAGSSGTLSPVFRYHNDRNALTTFARHAPWPVACRVWLRFPLAIAWHAARRHTRPLARTRVHAGLAATLRLPRTLVERRHLWTDAATSRRAVAGRWLDREG